jgi:hypothetical protein
MRRASWLMLFAMLLTPQAANAIQLHWAGGATDLIVSSNAQAVLVVQADSAEATLPNSWRLQWTADSLGAQFSAVGALACLADTAKVDSIALPATPADSAANQVTAYFCSAGSSNAATAYFLADLAANGHGRMKVVALDPADSTRVIESNEVTFNGGVDGDYAPLVLRATSVHQSLQLSVSVIGANLTGANALSIAAANGSWSLPLMVTAHSDSAMTGVASVAALLPACQATVGSNGGQTSGASLVADSEIQPDTTESGLCSAQYFEELLLSPPSPLGYEVQPKDFSFTPGFVDATTNRYALHLFYIRHNYWYYQPPGNPSLWHPELDEKNLGHAWTSDFVSWHGPAAGDKTDTTGIKVRSGKFDELHVWAPTIIKKSNGDPTFYMFYTGVRNEGGRENQRIGVATSTDLNTWTQVDSVVLSAPQVLWVKTNPTAHYGGSQQLRDPFVLEYPIGSGSYIMYFVAVDSSTGSAEDMSVGAAKSTDLRTWSPLPKPFAATQRPTLQGHTHIVESPHVFAHNGQWWMPYTVGENEVFFETSPSADPADTVAAHWTNPVWLRGVSQGQPAQVQYWHASEHLGSGSTEWLAAFNDNAISIDITGIFQTDSVGVDSLKLTCPSEPPTAGVGDPKGLPSQLRLAVLHPYLGSASVGLRLELPWRAPVHLAIYDIAGRKLTTLINREMPAGVSNVGWSGTDDSGRRVASGIYFVRLSSAKGARVSRIVMLR